MTATISESRPTSWAMALCFVSLSTYISTTSAAGENDEADSAAPQQVLRVSAVQMRSTRDLAENIARTAQYIEQCARDGARVVLFPECSVTGYFDKPFMQSFTARQLKEAEQQIGKACRTHNIYAIVGIPVREGDKLYNSAVVFHPSGQVLERYHKVQLAENWPDGGDHLSVFNIDDVPCSIIVCHDERYPELVRLPVLAGARLIFYISHESGIDQEHKVAPYRAQIQARAMENSVFVVHANAPANKDLTGSHGQSRFIAPNGNNICEASIFGEDVLTETLNVKQASGSLAQRSVDRGPLGDWWAEGAKRVRMIPDLPVADDEAAEAVKAAAR